MTIDDIARRFDAKRSGAGYMARCPAHEDDKASLGLSQKDGKILLHCFTGCSTEDIVRAKNLTMKDLFVSSNGHQRSPIVATYDYRDLTGKLRYQKRRTADKQFFFARPDGHDGWIASAKQNGHKPVMQGVERLLYRLHDLRERSEGSSSDTFRVYLAEGEKDVDRLWSLDLPATTNDDGAASDGQKPKWKRALTQQLKAVGATEVVCLPDNDEAGRAHMRAVADGGHAAGLVLRIVELSDLAPKGDVSDWLDAGHSIAELITLVDAADIYTPSSPRDDEPPVETPVARPTPMVTHARTLAEVHRTFTRWLGDGYDIDAINVVCAAAAAEQLAGDPLWLLVISGSGNAKTETVQSLSGVGAIAVSTIASEGALLSASPKRETTKDSSGGLLRRIGERGILVIKDVTSILSMQHNTRAGVLAALREIHDGRWERNVGTNGGKTLTWAGRLVIIGAVTTAWDTAHSVIATMGDRFVLLRMDSHVGRESAGRHAIGNTGREIDMRNELAEAVAGLLMTVDPQKVITLNDADRDTVLAAANVTTLCRTACEYDYRGDPIEAHAPEMPTRFAKQLTQIIRGGVAMGMEIDAAKRLAIRCARDSMPPLRLAILEDVWAHPGSQPAEVRERLDQPWSTVKRQLQSLYLLKVLTCQEITEEQIDVEVEESSDSKTEGETTKKTTKKKMKTTWRYFVADAINAAALGGKGPADEPAF